MQPTLLRSISWEHSTVAAVTTAPVVIVIITKHHYTNRASSCFTLPVRYDFRYQQPLPRVVFGYFPCEQVAAPVSYRWKDRS